jgi:flagellar M-ring protein FliF
VDPIQIFERLRSATKALTRTQLLSLVTAFVAVVAFVAGSAYYLNGVTFRLLFSDLDAESAASVVARLKAQKIPYELDDAGRSVRVPDTRVDELRLEFASQGMPSTGRIGFEIFDRTAFGATEFLEKVNYRRALEGEVARTIGTITEVASARVHIAMAKESLFGAQEQPAKASVVLKLRNKAPLQPATARAIQSLVASSIEGLGPDHVVLIDSYGRSLVRTANDGEDGADSTQTDRQQRVEKEMAARVVALLEPVVGQDRVRANVSVRLNNRTQEETEERYDPSSTVVRSRQLTSDNTVGAAAAGGVAGAKSNMPPPAPAPANAAPAAVPGAPGTPALLAGRSAETSNFEINKLVRHTIIPRGELARLTVAVIVDDEEETSKGKDGKAVRVRKPRDAAALKKIHGLVAAAVGFDETRGDILTVEAIPFDEPVVPEEAPLPAWKKFVEPKLPDVGRVGTILVLGLLAFFMVIRPVMRRMLAPIPEPAMVMPKALPKTVDQLQGELDAQIQDPVKSNENRRAQALAKRVATLSEKEPENVARLMRTWLSEGER